MWRKGNPFTLLVGMQTGAATVESTMEIPQKIKNGSAFWPSYPTSGNISKGTQNTNSKKHKHPVFIAALFIIAKIQKQSKCPPVDECIKQLWVIYTVEYCLAVKKGNFALCNSMDGTVEHYTKWVKPIRERQLPYDFPHMWNLMNKLK